MMHGSNLWQKDEVKDMIVKMTIHAIDISHVHSVALLIDGSLRVMAQAHRYSLEGGVLRCLKDPPPAGVGSGNIAVLC